MSPGCKYKSSLYVQIQNTLVYIILEKMYMVILVLHS